MSPDAPRHVFQPLADDAGLQPRAVAVQLMGVLQGGSDHVGEGRPTVLAERIGEAQQRLAQRRLVARRAE